MLVSRVISYGILLVVFNIARGLENNPYDNRLDNIILNPQGDEYILVSDFTTNIYHRWKRGVSLTAQGAIALRTLLSGAKSAYSKTEQYRNYHKQGDYVTAVQDFVSVNPQRVSVKKMRHEKTVVSGLVGDRRLVLYEESPVVGGPMLDIVDMTAKARYKSRGPRTKSVDRIMYKKTLYNTGQLF